MNKVALLSESEERALRLRQLASVFTKADTTLAGHRVVVNISGDRQSINVGQAPAASTRGTITFNPSLLPNPATVEGLVKINGLNYHELAHILYTPQQGTALVSAVTREQVYAAFNILEDQRIETLLIAKYASVKAYLVATVAEYFLDVDKSRHNTAWPYLYGRKYLPANMRNYFRNIALKDHTMKTTIGQLEMIIDEYVTLNVHNPANVNRALDLIKRFSALIGGTQEFTPFSHQGQSTAASGGAQGQSPNEQATEAEKANQDAQTQAASGGPGADSDEDLDDDLADGWGDGEGEGDSEGSGSGGGNGIGSGGPSADPKKMLEDVAEEARQDKSIQQEIRNQKDALRPDGKYNGRLDNAVYGEQDTGIIPLAASRKFGQELSRLVVEADPGWDTHRPSGRLNVRRHLQGGEFDTIFDEWAPGRQDADSLEVVILVDSSGSMSGEMRDASEAMWTIKAGVESLGHNARVSVIEFNSECRYIYRPGEPAKRNKFRAVRAIGGTNPSSGIFEGLRIFANSQRKRKLFIVISDGGWSDANRAEEYIRRMNANHIHTVSLFLGNELIAEQMRGLGQASDYYRHECKQFSVVTGCAELGVVGREIVKNMMKSR